MKSEVTWRNNWVRLTGGPANDLGGLVNQDDGAEDRLASQQSPCQSAAIREGIRCKSFQSDSNFKVRSYCLRRALGPIANRLLLGQCLSRRRARPGAVKTNRSYNIHTVSVRGTRQPEDWHKSESFAQ